MAQPFPPHTVLLPPTLGPLHLILQRTLWASGISRPWSEALFSMTNPKTGRWSGKNPKLFS